MSCGLVALAPSPVVELNRAVAVAMADDPEQGLALIDDLVEGGELDGYHLLHSARAEPLTRLGRHGEAQAGFGRALALATNEVDRRHLSRRLDSVSSN